METGTSNGGWGSFFEHWGTTVLALALGLLLWVFSRLFFGG